MKRIIVFIVCSFLVVGVHAQTAIQVLDKTAAIVGRRGGASAQFRISSAIYGSTSGSLAIKGRQFHARTPQAWVWFNGKTQWTYLKSTNEVNVSTPTQAKQLTMNPMTFINIYKTGFNSSISKSGGDYVIHLVAQNKQRSIQELQITVNSVSYIPSMVKMRQGRGWSTIHISNFKPINQANSTFVFHAKDFPTAEVIDLR